MIINNSNLEDIMKIMQYGMCRNKKTKILKSVEYD